MRKAIKFAAVVVIVCALIAGTAQAAHYLYRQEQEPRTLYHDAYLTVERTGRRTSIYDGISGREYTYTMKRARRTTDANTAHRARTSTDTDTLTIQTAQGVLIVTVKGTGDTLIFRCR